ncbi:MAG: hypothetical protein ACI9FZ_000652 [Bacteroidia bacterium]|jgi:hypothetical protein
MMNKFIQLSIFHLCSFPDNGSLWSGLHVVVADGDVSVPEEGASQFRESRLRLHLVQLTAKSVAVPGKF